AAAGKATTKASAGVSAKTAASLQRIQRREGSKFPKEPLKMSDEYNAPSGPLDPRAMAMWGFSQTPKRRPMGRWPGAVKTTGSVFKIQSGQPTILNARSALSAALMT